MCLLLYYNRLALKTFTLLKKENTQSGKVRINSPTNNRRAVHSLTLRGKCVFLKRTTN